MEKAVAGGTAQELNGPSCTTDEQVNLKMHFLGIFILTR